MAGPKYISPEGLEKIKKELDYLKTIKRKEIIERIERAKELGDLSENAEYADAKEEQSFTEGKILELEEMVNNAVIIEKGKGTGVVDIGSVIKVKTNGEEKEFTIVGSSETIPEKGIISNESPLGQAFLGKRVGDEAEVTVPKGIIKYKITDIQ
jgi:transcription elongation factor GreA